MKNAKVLLVASFCFFLFVGCATLFSGGSTDVRIESEPEGAEVYIDGISENRQTPATITLDHSYSDVWSDEEVELRLEGYEDRRFKIDHGLAGWYWGNILLGPFAGIGGLVDLVTGSWASVDKTQYRVELREGTGNVDENNSSFYAKHVYIEDLKKDENGRYIIPNYKKKMIVHDKKYNKKLVIDRMTE